MLHPFTPAASDLRAITHKLQVSCYQAQFGKTAEVRLKASQEAIKLNAIMEQHIVKAYDTVTAIAGWMNSAGESSQLESALAFMAYVDGENQQLLIRTSVPVDLSAQSTR